MSVSLHKLRIQPDVQICTPLAKIFKKQTRVHFFKNINCLIRNVRKTGINIQDAVITVHTFLFLTETEAFLMNAAVSVLVCVSVVKHIYLKRSS